MAHRRSALALKKSSKILSEKPGSSAASPVVVCDKDPYEFVDSQSLQPDTHPPTKLHTNSSGLRQMTPRGVTEPSSMCTPLSVSKTGHHRTPSRPLKPPRILSEDERLEQDESEQLQRALEASLLEKEMEDRKWRRRRREEMREKEEQDRIMQQLKKKQKKLSEEDPSESELASEDKDSTRPLPTTSSVAVGAGVRDSKQVMVSVKKLNISSIRSTKSHRIQSKSGTGDSECVDKDSSVAVRRYALREGSTPPLSQEEASPVSHKVIPPSPTSTDPDQQRMVVARDRETLSTEEKDCPQESYCSGQNRLPLDVGLVETLTTSSNFDANTPSSPSLSMPFKVVSNLELTPDIPASHSESNVSTLKERVHSSAEPPESTILITVDSPSHQTDSCAGNESLQTIARGKPRSGGLSLSRKKRKRVSTEVLFEEVAPPLKVPLAKKIRPDIATVLSPSETRSQNFQSDSKGGNESAEDRMSPSSDAEYKPQIEDKCLSVKTGKSSPNPAATPRDNLLRSTSILTSKSDTAPQSGLPSSPEKKHTDLHALNPRLPLMFCPPGNSPMEYTPLIIHRFNSYFTQLREAQSKVLTRLKWGKPVKMGSTRQLSLDVGRQTRRSRNANKNINNFYLVLSKRETSNTLEQSESVARKSLKRNSFSLSSDSEKSQEDTTRPSSSKQKDSQEVSAPSLEMVEDSQTVPSQTDNDLTAPSQTDNDLTAPSQSVNDLAAPSQSVNDLAAPSQSVNDLAAPSQSVNDIEMEPMPAPSYSDTRHHLSMGSDSVDKTGVILLDTQLDEQTTTTRPASPLQPSITSQESPATSSVLQRSSHDLAEKDSEKANASQGKDTPLPTWLNSRVQEKSSESARQRKITPRQKLSTLKRTPTTRNGKKPKSAATRMILEFSRNSASDGDDVAKRSSSRDPPPQAHSDTSDEEYVVQHRSTAAKGNRRKLSSSSSDNEQESESGVIDLTEDTQLSQHTSSLHHAPTTTPTHHSPSQQLPSPPTSRRLRRQSRQQATCPLCSKKFHPSVIEIHASQCSGTEHSASINFRTKQSASRGKTRRSYQPTLRQLQMKEKEMATKAGEDIDSASDVEQLNARVGVDVDASERGPPLLEELSNACQKAPGDSSTSPSSAMETRLIPSEDGGFIVDESTISNSPIRTFTKISEMGAKDRERFQNQFKARSLPKKRTGASDTAWSNNFSDLAQSSRAPKGQGKQQNNWTRKRGKGSFFKGRGKFIKRRPRN